jgi:putative DNA primase/helicase
VLVSIWDGENVSVQRLIPFESCGLAELMTQTAQFERFDLRSMRWTSINAPPLLANTYLERQGKWRVRPLVGLLNAPTLRSDGSLLDTPGYDERTGLRFDPGNVLFPPIPEEPSHDDAVLAAAVLEGLLVGFPFVTEVDRCVALSAILTSAMRTSLRSSPLHGFTSPTAGTGKSKLVDIVSMIAWGTRAPVISQGWNQAEQEKRLGAAAIAGDLIIAIDNCERPLGGDLLCQMLTQQVVQVRELGKSRNIEVPCIASVFATGNNLVLLGDMTRRALLCSLDAGVERPELRKFKDDPVGKVESDRGTYVTAALTILRAYNVAGRPCPWIAWIVRGLV